MLLLPFVPGIKQTKEWVRCRFRSNNANDTANTFSAVTASFFLASFSAFFAFPASFFEFTPLGGIVGLLSIFCGTHETRQGEDDEMAATTFGKFRRGGEYYIKRTVDTCGRASCEDHTPLVYAKCHIAPFFDPRCFFFIPFLVFWIVLFEKNGCYWRKVGCWRGLYVLILRYRTD